MKTQLPTQFTSKDGGKKEYDVDNLPGGNGGTDTITQEQFNQFFRVRKPQLNTARLRRQMMLETTEELRKEFIHTSEDETDD